MLSALGANELGFLFGPMPGFRSFHRAYLFLGLVGWAFVPIFKPYHIQAVMKKQYIVIIKLNFYGLTYVYIT